MLGNRRSLGGLSGVRFGGLDCQAQLEIYSVNNGESLHVLWNGSNVMQAEFAELVWQ